MRVTQSIIQHIKNEKLRNAFLRLIEVNDYYSLLEGSLETYVSAFDVLGKMPEQLKEWLKVFNGGHLFFISMLTTRERVSGMDYPTFQEINSEKYKKQNSIANEVACFAIASDGDMYCFDKEENSDKIYEWDCREGKAVDEWADFADWLNDRIDFAIKEINDGILTPMVD